MAIPSKLIYRINAVPLETLMGLKKKQADFKIYMEINAAWSDEIALRK